MTYRAPIENIGPKSAFDEGDYGFNDNTLNSAPSNYDFNYLKFPNDLGQENNGHYMVININVPVARTRATSAFVDSAFGGGRGFYTQTEELSKVDRLSGITSLGLRPPLPTALRFGTTVEGTRVENFPQLYASVGRSQSQYFLSRSTKRIKESIALFMPAPLVFTTEHTYENVSLTGLFGGIAATAISAVGAAAVSRAGQILSNIGSSAVGGGARAAQVGGMPINPRIEVLFATTVQREFRFELLLAPRNVEESRAVKSIVKTLRFHAAPELTAAGFAFIPPAEFDITFFNKGVENTNIPRINTSVLNSIEVQYDPTGIYSTFSNGHPVSIRLGLGFRELEIGHKLRIAQGF